jgi:hypothetical protein
MPQVSYFASIISINLALVDEWNRLDGCQEELMGIGFN